MNEVLKQLHEIDKNNSFSSQGSFLYYEREIIGLVCYISVSKRGLYTL